MKKQNLLILGLVLSMFTWGLSWPSGKILSSYGSASAIACLRFIVTFLGLLPLLLLLKQPLSLKKDGYLTLIFAGMCMSGYSYLFFNGLKYGKPGAGGVMVTTLNPVFSYLLGILLNRKLPTRNEAIGLILGLLAGAVLLHAWNSDSTLFNPGNSFFILASITWAALSKFTSKAGKYGSSISFSLWMYLICSLLLLNIAGFAEIDNVIKKSDSVFWLNMFFSAIITTTFATSFYFYSTTELGAEKASSFIFLVPLSAALSSLFLLQETITWNTILGGVLGAVAVFSINKK
ncbi:MAG: DMT family transporter [Opitutaceae bacterium]|nr:DMT family transporter [Cytophagales bacterium]